MVTGNVGWDCSASRRVPRVMPSLAAVGLTLKDAENKKVKRAPAEFKPKADHTYQHPENPTLTCKGNGVKPAWWHEVLKAGKQPIDKGPVRKEAA